MNNKLEYNNYKPFWYFLSSWIIRFRI